MEKHKVKPSFGTADKERRHYVINWEDKKGNKWCWSWLGTRASAVKAASAARASMAEGGMDATYTIEHARGNAKVYMDIDVYVSFHRDASGYVEGRTTTVRGTSWEDVQEKLQAKVAEYFERYAENYMRELRHGFPSLTKPKPKFGKGT